MEGEAFKITQPTAFLIKFRLSKILQSHQRSGHLLLVMHIASTAQQSSVQAVLQLPRSLIINRLISSMKGTLICKRKFKDYTVYPYKLSDLEPSSPPPAYLSGSNPSRREQLGILVQPMCLMCLWHLVGSLQKNKARHVVGRFCLIHSVDSVPLAGELGRRAVAASIRARARADDRLAVGYLRPQPPQAFVIGDGHGLLRDVLSDT